MGDLRFRESKMRIKSAIWFMALCVGMGSTAMLAQDKWRKDPCEAKPAGQGAAAKNFLTFDQFDKELRAALTREDPLALAFLVKFPLRVNDARGSIALNDADTLKSYFQEVFPAAVRKEILADKVDSPGCAPGAIGYGSGVIWVHGTSLGYAIWTVNRDAVSPNPTDDEKAPKIDFTCQTQSDRIVIDTVSGGAIRYRSWAKPHPLTAEPDVEIPNGERTYEGSHVCGHPVYRFDRGTTTYTVEDGPCAADSKTPKDATGTVQITVAGKWHPDTFCF